jgi:hypothetical protein
MSLAVSHAVPGVGGSHFAGSRDSRWCSDVMSLWPICQLVTGGTALRRVRAVSAVGGVCIVRIHEPVALGLG